MHRTESGLGMKLSTSTCNIKKIKLKAFDLIRFEWTEITVGFTKRCLSGLGPVTTSLWHSVHPLSAGGRGGEPPTNFSKRVDSTGTRFLEGVAGKERGDLFQGGL